MQFLRCIELMQRGDPVSIARIAACTRTSRESVRNWMMMLAAHNRVEQLDVPPPRLGAPVDWWQWKTAIPKELPAPEKMQIRRNPWGLTSREVEVMNAVCTAKDRAHKLAARDLGVEPITVKTAVRRIGKKMNISGPEQYDAWERWVGIS